MAYSSSVASVMDEAAPRPNVYVHASLAYADKQSRREGYAVDGRTNVANHRLE